MASWTPTCRTPGGNPAAGNCIAPSLTPCMRACDPALAVARAASAMPPGPPSSLPVSYTHLRAHETDSYL
eukprot:4838160-Pleurochrysis_carterae.AAC.1